MLSQQFFCIFLTFKLAIKSVWVCRFWWSIPFFSTLDRGECNETVHFKICDILNQKCVTSLWRHHVFEKTRKSKNLVLAKIESLDLKNDFKKGFSDEYFQKSETSFWHGVSLLSIAWLSLWRSILKTFLVQIDGENGQSGDRVFLFEK